MPTPLTFLRGWFLRVICLAAATWWSMAGAVAAQPSQPELEYRALWTFSGLGPPEGTVRHSEEEQAWVRDKGVRLYERAMKFCADYPDHPLRWDVWALLSVLPQFEREVTENGVTRKVPDLERQQAFRVRQRESFEQILEAPDASARARDRAFNFLIKANANRWTSRMNTPEGQAALKQTLAWFARYQRELPASVAHINAARALAEMLDRADPADCQRFLLGLIRHYASDTPRDRELREMAQGRLKLLQGQAHPVWLRLAALDGRFADTQDYIGKIVLIAVAPITWEQPIAFMRELHATYHAQGFEIIHVTGGDALVQGEGQRTALATALEVDEKNLPWRVAWDRKGTIGEFSRSLGKNVYPAYLLISRDGRFVMETSLRGELTAAIERELRVKDTAPAPSVAAAAVASTGSPALIAPEADARWTTMNLDGTALPDVALQAALDRIDTTLRAKYGMAEADTAAGVLDLRTGRLAWVRPNAITYGASVPKIGILLAWFHDHPEAVTSPDPVQRHELGEMIKQSSNEMATKFSRPLGIARIQAVLNEGGFYDAAQGGGIWFGKHYGQDSERVRDPVGGNSHAVNVRQLVRYYLLLEQGRLISPEASRAMREIFASPDIPHLNDRFVKSLAGRGVELRRKSGWWETWSHDSAVVTGAGRHYIVVGLTHHARGTEYLEEFAARVDDELTGVAGGR